jgi:hypothetical protein
MSVRSGNVAMLQDRVTQLSTRFERFVGDASTLQSASAGIQSASEGIFTLKSQISRKLIDPVVEQLSMGLFHGSSSASLPITPLPVSPILPIRSSGGVM